MDCFSGSGLAQSKEYRAGGWAHALYDYATASALVARLAVTEGATVASLMKTLAVLANEDGAACRA